MQYNWEYKTGLFRQYELFLFEEWSLGSRRISVQIDLDRKKL